MRIPLKWLAEYVNVTLPPEALARRLTLAGLECAAIESFPPGRSDWENVFVARVLQVAPHPNADRLRLATVEWGAGEAGRLTVVCGAPNVAAGQKIAFARAGARLIDGHTGRPTALKVARIRGVESAGMVCSERELGLSEEHAGILVLPDDAPVGAPLADYLGDTVLDLEVTANRPDCLSVLGIAREVAALTGQAVREPPASYPEGPEPVERLASVAVEAPDLCPRYCGAVITGVKVGESPAWLQERLKAAGMRSINNVVDVTNYVMLEYGEPLHAFDLERLLDRRIVVRRARPGEALVTIDGGRRPLAPEMLVIADSRVPLALAGVMGGAESEVTEATTELLLEAANFNRASIRRTARALALRSEASLRFEKGLSPELPGPALRRACRLLHELAGGTVARGTIDIYPGREPPRSLRLPRAQIARILGTTIPDEQVERALRGLGFGVEPAPSAAEGGRGERVVGTVGWEVAVPYWRTDIDSYFDLVEELARVVGYDVLPTASLAGPLPAYQPQPMLELKERLRDLLAAAGLQEVITYPLVSRTMLAQGASGGEGTPLRAYNPMSPAQEHLRTDLRPSILATIAANEDRGERGQALFEVGRVYLRRPRDLPEERETLVAAFAGPRQSREAGWLAQESRHVGTDFYDAKGALEGLLAALHLEASFEPVLSPDPVGTEDPLLLPGRSARVSVGGVQVGMVGEVRPEALRACDISAPTVALFSVELAALLPLVGAGRGYTPLSRYPPVGRDIAILIDKDTPSARVEGIVRAQPLVASVAPFDVYQGEGIPPGKVSLAYHIVYQSSEHSLRDEEVERAQAGILRRLERELGATLRG
ncbi:MAG: phenylalanine--tRNA ligase subunit beta [Dehalococcoidia bacterium]|nr:phenylalanine--tRNA ligase subunit beta [Dehalococcoidia bacterium]